MSYKKYSAELVDIEEDLRNNFLDVFHSFDISNTSVILLKEEKINALLNSFLKIITGSSDEIYGKNYKFLTESLFHIVKWINKELNGTTGEANLKAAKVNASLIDLNAYNYPPAFKQSIQEIIESVNKLTEAKNAKTVFVRVCQISFPFIYAIDYDPYRSMIDGQSREPSEDDQNDAKMTVVSIEFLIDNEPWANPQVLKPQVIYTIKGKLLINEWPRNFDKLILKPISAQSNSIYEIILPEIPKTANKEIEVSGQVLFKFPQSSFDEVIAVKLLSYFQNDFGETLLTTIIGYNQLIAKVLDPNSFPFLTGFQAMNKVVFDIDSSLQKELPNLDTVEKNDFLYLLSGIVNYQGYALQHGIYKFQNDVSEDIFRDNLIQHLVGLPYIGENIIKEASLAGGRVEIGYKGLIAELKVEKTISDRDELIKKYSKQPVSYSSGNTKQLSILCILDLTEKKLPPAAPQNSIKLITPAVHGFQNAGMSHPSKQVVIVIDGNTKNPSDYSR